jgi:hypothetical protein
MKKKLKATVCFSGLLVCVVMSLSAQNVHAQLRNAWSQTTTTIVYEDVTGEIQDVRLGGNPEISGMPTPTPRRFWGTVMRVATLGLLGSPASPAHMMRETVPRLLDATVQVDDANLQMSIRLLSLLQRRGQLRADVRNLTIQVRNERERQERQSRRVMPRVSAALEELGDIFRELRKLGE